MRGWDGVGMLQRSAGEGGFPSVGNEDMDDRNSSFERLRPLRD